MAFFEGENVQVHLGANGIALVSIDVPNRTYNVFSRQVLVELDQALDRLRDCSDMNFMALMSGKDSGFIAGADLQEFKLVKKSADAIAISATGQSLFSKLAALPIPTAAIIHGPCLGGGLECALACDYRIVLNSRGTQIGLPEIELGLLPGWGGTQRLPCVVGLERALQVILQRRRLNAIEALRWGLADFLCNSQEEALTHIAKEWLSPANRVTKRPKQGVTRRTWRQRLLESTGLGRGLIFRGAERILRRRVPDDMPAPLEALQAVRTGSVHGQAAGLAYEREAIGRLALTKACRNLVTLFFLIENARKPPDAGQSDAQPKIRRIGVVGAGTMGAGIAQLASIKGFDVVIQEINETALAAGVLKIEELFRKAVERGVLSRSESERLLANLGKTTTWQGFGAVDVVVEAAIEDLHIKQAIFRQLESCTPESTILASNTSSLPVHRLQEGLQHPERVAGFHFFNPVHKMPLVEVIRTSDTTESVISGLVDWAAKLSKTPVVVKDSPGFVVNRILMPYLNEAGMLVAEGLPIEKIDQIMRQFGMPMGPLELLDQVGLDVAAHIAHSIGPTFGDRIVPNPALEAMSANGWLGQKNGKGFYVYHKKKKVTHAAALEKLRKDFGTASGLSQSVLSSQRLADAQERMVCVMVNEAAACLSEGLAERADVIDLAMVLGTGWAPHRGGPLRYADDRGVNDVVKQLDDLTNRIGQRFEPCPELRRRVATQQLFYQFLGEPQAA